MRGREPKTKAEKSIALVAHWDWVLYNFRLPLARALRKGGHRVILVCPFGKYVEQLRAADFPWVPWHVQRRSFNPFWEVLAILHLTQTYRRIRPQAVHHFTIKPNLYGTIAARLAGVPVIINTFTGLGYIFSDSSSKLRRLREWLLFPIMRQAFRTPAVFTVFQTEQDRRHFLDLGLVLPHRTAVIAGSGVDVFRFYPASKSTEEGSSDGPTLLLAARLLREKGIEEFIQAARRLKAKSVKARFWVAGDLDRGNPDCIPDEVLSAWCNEGIVEFLGHRSDMADLLRQVDIAVLPSYHEGVPRFLLEAAATGLPLVATDIEGCRMVVHEGVNGFLVPPRNPEALAEALERLIRDPELRRRMGAASREIAVREFNEVLVVERYLDLYRQLGVLADGGDDG